MPILAPRAMPHFPIERTPEQWDAFTLHAGNIYAEAEGEPPEGQLAVGWVVINRSRAWRLSVRDVILSPQQFSWLNLDERAMHLRRLGRAMGAQLESAWRAAAASYWRLLPDPTDGATHYLNIEATRALRRTHDLPDWAEAALDRGPVIVLGHHTFLRA